MIYRLARARGLQDADAQDLVQQVLISVAKAIPRWHRAETGVRFRHWLRRVAKNAILNALARQPKDRGGGSAMMDLLKKRPDPDRTAETQIETEYRRELYLQAAQQVRTSVRLETWQAFQRTVIEGQSVDTAARQLDCNVGVIYAARSRIIRRLREAVRRLEQEE
ncbi:MAG: sigma-70 family RNA polymerase sigma factor, partial [Pirellulales bacterium]|nr:sigma-70 family RNA polymerase sigma factor [Pirellulales bacterium]